MNEFTSEEFKKLCHLFARITTRRIAGMQQFKDECNCGDDELVDLIRASQKVAGLPSLFNKEKEMKAKLKLGYNKYDIFLTGTGQALTKLHERSSDCDKYGCVIHNPTKHCMSKFKTHWREDRSLMERICKHGIGHPDPDDLAFKKRRSGKNYAKSESVHGCDGCCRESK